MFNQITVIGIGLLGASLARGIRRHNIAKTVKLWARRKDTLEDCKMHDWCTVCEEDITKSVVGSNLVVICTPVESIPRILDEIAPFLDNHTIVTDVGSVKVDICERAKAVFENLTSSFIGSHPMAGSEKSGMKYATDNLFDNKTCVITPNYSNEEKVQNQVEHFWQSMQMDVITVSPQEHDEAVAYFSHLPHLISSSLAKTLYSKPNDWIKVSGNGLRDTTRIAEGDPSLWEQICFMNRKNLIHAIEEVESTIDQVKKSLIENDKDELLSVLNKGSEFRKGL
jgi:prephenate dehydrogenase